MTAPAAGIPRPLLGLIMALAGALIITPDTLLIRLSGLEGWALSFWRGILIGFGLMVFWLMLERRKAITQIPMLLGGPAIIIIIANFINAISFNFATMETSITVVVTALATAPLVAAVLGFFILGERLGMKTWIAVAISMVGVMIVILNGEGALDAPPGNVWLGGGLGFLAAFGIAVVFVTTRKHPDVPVLPACAIGTFVSGLVGYVGAPAGGIMAGDMMMILLMGLLVMPVSWGLLTLAPRYTSPTNVSLFMLLEMVLGPFWVWLGTGERPSPAMIGGAALVLVTLAFYFLAAANEARRDKDLIKA
jgi:drug/metabolite transporter (DMT)-like permease